MVDRPTEPGETADEELAELSPLGAPATLAAGRESRRKGRNQGDGGVRRRRLGLGPGVGAVAALVAILLLAVVPTIGTGLKKTPRDKVGISYGGGPVEGSHFQRVVKPGSALFFNGLFDPLYLYPADQRNYIISKQEGVGAESGSDSVVAPSKDRVQVEYQVAVYFKLNTNRLRQFHEQLGLKYNAYTSSGWDKLITETFRQQIENALQEATRRYDVADLYGNADLLVGLQQQVQQTLSQRLIDALGEQYFCAPTFTPDQSCQDPTFVVKKIDIPESVAKAYEANRTSQVAIQTKRNEIQQRTAEAEAIQALSQALAAAGKDYVLLKAIESGKISFWVLPSDSGLTLTAPGAGDGGG